jgi:putrescine transport system ATP-binding protein
LPRLAVEHLTKRFGETVAVDDVSVEIAAGECLVLLGPSGCGKSTLLRLVAGFETPEAGAIRIDGEDVARLAPHLRPTNMMFQSYALFPHMDVAGNVGFGLKQAGADRATIAREVERLLALVRLEGFGARRVDQLSGGQRQRVALARALARQPKLLLLDEPLGALDKALRFETQAELKRLKRELGLTMLVVTHDQDEAMVLGDRIAVMRAGRFAQVGTPRDIYERPVDRFVAGFCGETNILDATVIEGGIESALGRRVVPTLPGLAPGDRVGLALRPEQIRLVEGGRHAGTIASVAYLGDITYVTVALDAGVALKILVANTGRGAFTPDRVGERVTIDHDADALVVLRD